MFYFHSNKSYYLAGKEAVLTCSLILLFLPTVSLTLKMHRLWSGSFTYQVTTTPILVLTYGEQQRSPRRELALQTQPLQVPAGPSYAGLLALPWAPAALALHAGKHRIVGFKIPRRAPTCNEACEPVSHILSRASKLLLNLALVSLFYK